MDDLFYLTHLTQIFTQVGRAEELGTGVKNVYKYSKAYSGSNKIVFKEDDVFITQVPLKHFLIVTNQMRDNGKYLL